MYQKSLFPEPFVLQEDLPVWTKNTSPGSPVVLPLVFNPSSDIWFWVSDRHVVALESTERCDVVVVNVPNEKQIENCTPKHKRQNEGGGNRDVSRGGCGRALKQDSE
jgi:hypothetical protein